MNARDRIIEILARKFYEERHMDFDKMHGDQADEILAELPKLVEVDEIKLANYIWGEKIELECRAYAKQVSSAIAKAKDILKVRE